MCADAHVSAVVRMSECECTKLPYNGSGCALERASPRRLHFMTLVQGFSYWSVAVHQHLARQGEGGTDDLIVIVRLRTSALYIRGYCIATIEWRRDAMRSVLSGGSNVKSHPRCTCPRSKCGRNDLAIIWQHSSDGTDSR
jgi:hypothetical protein